MARRSVPEPCRTGHLPVQIFDSSLLSKNLLVRTRLIERLGPHFRPRPLSGCKEKARQKYCRQAFFPFVFAQQKCGYLQTKGHSPSVLFYYYLIKSVILGISSSSPPRFADSLAIMPGKDILMPISTSIGGSVSSIIHLIKSRIILASTPPCP